jgi:hypothetical protein
MAVNLPQENANLEGYVVEPTFLLLYCSSCEREVLSACELDSKSEIIDICLHCDQTLDREDGSARWVEASVLDDHGYFVEGSEKRADRHGGGGCRDGACGVQQPE